MRLRLPQISFPLSAPRGQPLCSAHGPARHRSRRSCTSCSPTRLCPFPSLYPPKNLLSDPLRRYPSISLRDFWRYFSVHHINLDTELFNLSASPVSPSCGDWSSSRCSSLPAAPENPGAKLPCQFTADSLTQSTLLEIMHLFTMALHPEINSTIQASV